MEKVWLVNQGVRTGSHSTLGVFSTEEKAIKWTEEYVKNIDVNTEKGMFFRLGTSLWVDNYEYISIVHLTVDSAFDPDARSDDLVAQQGQ